MQGGPWMLFDHYLIVRLWSLEFVTFEDKVNSTLIWVCFPSLGMVCYNKSVLLTMASVIGKSIRVDLNTLNTKKRCFALVYVEISLDKPIMGKFNLKSICYIVEYEGLHMLCASCDCCGQVCNY
uniref:Uncharacterized protein n=1 Tax=Cajanus cajan TaxID=3821 RepID=A0A151S3I9_CAJCA|nr:hypothetical protein KK1_028919 [Cajanus cajan]KYP57868.1 hypothetical protein KK1_004149 [Cajanus cajan]